MPKRIRKLKGHRLADPELHACIHKAGLAAGRRSTLNDGEIALLAKVGMGGWLPLPLADEDGNLPAINRSDITHESLNRDLVSLAWIFHRDPAGAAAAIIAAHKEWNRIERTPIWRARRVLRNHPLRDSLSRLISKRELEYDMQAIMEQIHRESGFNVRAGLVHKANREEAKFQARAVTF